MHEFFSGCRRKAGCVALVMALGQGRTRSQRDPSPLAVQSCGPWIGNLSLTAGNFT